MIRHKTKITNFQSKLTRTIVQNKMKLPVHSSVIEEIKMINDVASPIRVSDLRENISTSNKLSNDLGKIQFLY